MLQCDEEKSALFDHLRGIQEFVLDGRDSYRFLFDGKGCIVFASISVSTRACHARKLGSTPRQRDLFARVQAIYRE